MLKYTGALAKYPARAMFGTYLLAILVGGLLLYTPWARNPVTPETPAGQRPDITLVDSFFTATSAVCVTGLSVRPTGTYFSTFGHVVILGLIQIGGVGIMTLTTFFTKLLGAADNLRDRQTLSETLGAGSAEGVRRVGLRVLGATLVIEAIGVALLLPVFMRDRPMGEALWWAVFHSVSAFCNAGFSLHDDNLAPWRADPLLNFTIMGLILFGGIGFPVLTDIRRSISRQVRETGRPQSRLWGRLLLSTKITLVGTVVLLVGGTIAIALLEWDRTLAGMTTWEKIQAAMFASVTPRTAGFNTIDYGKMAGATLFVTMLLMFVGGGSASTAGGTKVGTCAVVLAVVTARLLGRRNVQAFQRTLTPELIERAFIILLLFGGLTVLGTLGVLVVGETLLRGGTEGEHDLFLKASFEVISALCTVGLSTGITAGLADVSKVVLILLMFVGRIGPISLYVALAREHPGVRARPVREDVLIG